MALVVGFLLHYLLPHLRKLLLLFRYSAVDHGSGGGVPAGLPAAPPPHAVVVLDIVLWIMALVVGFLLHYLLPHLRKLLLLF